MTITAGDESLSFSDILVGVEWVCSGQSNMKQSVGQSHNAALEILAARYPKIRIISVPQVGTQELQDDFIGEWAAIAPETAPDFSAVGYYFGRQLHQTLNMPIGLIDTAWGGSAAEAWVRRDVLEADPKYADYIAQWKEIEATFDFEKERAKWKAEDAERKAAGEETLGRPPRNLLSGQHRPGNLYAGVLHPIIGYPIRGVVWYQGENNAVRAWNYRNLFPLMISHWREQWQQGDFPFYWVQLADYGDEVAEPEPSDWAVMRESQSYSLKLPNTGQAVICDVGEGRDIHPRNKQEVGKRLARIALARDYGKDIVYQSPSFDSVKFKGKDALVTFKDTGIRRYTFDVRDAVGFAIAGKDQVWHNAQARLIGANRVKVWSENVEEPVAVRYAWADNPVVNLQNREGLPAAPFRTDDWPVPTQPQ